MEELLESIALKVYKEYLYLNLDKNRYSNYIKNIKYESVENYENELIKYCERETKNKLKDNELEVINNYINFICEQNYNTLNTLRKISNFFSKYKLNSKIDILSYLVVNNYNLNNLFLEFNNLLNDSEKNILLKNLNDNIITMIQLYCDINDIEIQEEIESNININDPLSAYYQEIKKYPLFNREEEREIFVKINNGDKEAYDYFVKCNLRLVLKFVKKYDWYHDDIWDLINEGNLGLMQAVSRFDPEKGFKFSTYAQWWIKNYVYKYIGKNSRSLKLPRHAINEIKTYHKTKEKLEQKLGYEVGIYEIAKEMGIDEKKVSQIQVLSQDAIRLNEYVNDEEKETELIDFIPDPEQKVDSLAIEKISMQEITKLLDRINYNERDIEIFKLRYGIEDGKCRSLDEIGSIYHVSRERIRQIENNILKRLKHIIKYGPAKECNNIKLEANADRIYNKLSKIGPRDDMEKIIKNLDNNEIEILNEVLGKENIQDDSISLYTKYEFYNRLLPKIKRYYKSLKDYSHVMKKIQSEKEYDEILQSDVLIILKVLKKQITKELYTQLSYEQLVILAFELNDICKNITDKSIADYFGISEISIKEMKIDVLNKYKEYLEHSKSKNR